MNTTIHPLPRDAEAPAGPANIDRRSRGSALIIVLWVIAFLSFLVITSLMVARQDVDTSISRQEVARARQLAEMGLAIGAHPMVKPGDPLLRQRVSATESFEAVVSSEEARLNLNSLLTDNRRRILERLLERWSLPRPAVQTVVDSLIDWVDPDDFKRLTGAERQDYLKAGFKHRPFNRPFVTLDEAAMVQGMDLVAEANPRWREAFTLWGGGALDLNAAEADLIEVMADIPKGGAIALVRTRDGPDGLLQTRDDQPIKTVGEALAMLGIPGGNEEVAASWFTLQGAVRRIDSVGRIGNRARRISVITLGGAGSTILEWRESAE